MKSVVRPELPTASVGSSQAPTAAVDNSAPLVITAESTYKSGKSVQTTGATSACERRTETTAKISGRCLGRPRGTRMGWLLIPSSPAASAPTRPGLGFIDANWTTLNFPAIELLDRRVRRFIGRHLDETEAA